MPQLDETALTDMDDAQLARHLGKAWDAFKDRAQGNPSIDVGAIDQVDRPFRDLVSQVETGAGTGTKGRSY